MISETTFATSYTSFWKSLTPNHERFTRRLNLGVERFELPIIAKSAPDRRGYLNEVGFLHFSHCFHRGMLKKNELTKLKKDIFEEARQSLALFEGVEESQLVDPSANEQKEVSALHKSLTKFATQFSSGPDQIVISPKFRGCGFLDTCKGDLIIGERLIEVKAGERSFRATDLRQLLAYCALNSCSSEYQISCIGCVNPRRGTYFLIDLDELCLELSNRSSTELLSEIIYFISSGDLSH